MRTRSQPASPGGLVSLEDMQRATRRTRSTRSASRGASQEPSSQQTTEPATQPATRSKSQRTVKKTTTTTKNITSTMSATSAASGVSATSTTSTIKTQTRKTPKRGTRKTTRKAGKAASDEPQESIGEKYLETAGADSEENAEIGTEEPVSGPSMLDSTQLEPKRTERKYPITPSPSQTPSPLHSPSYLPSPVTLPPLPSLSPCLPHSRPQEALELELDELLPLEQQIRDLQTFDVLAASGSFSDLLAHNETEFNWDLPDLGETPVPTWDDLDFEEKDQVSIALAETPSPPPIGRDSITMEIPQLPNEVLAEIDFLLESYKAMAITAALDEEFTQEQVIASPLASTVDTERQAIATENWVDDLAKNFANMTLLCPVAGPPKKAPALLTQPSREPAKEIESKPDGTRIPEPTVDLAAEETSAPHRWASIYDPYPSPGPSTINFLPRPKPVPPLTLFSSIPDSPSSIYDDGQAPPKLHASEERQRVEDALKKSISGSPLGLFLLPPRRRGSGARKKHRAHIWQRTPLSPIMEEKDTGSGVGVEPSSTPTTSIAPITPLAHLVETPNSPSSTPKTTFEKPLKRTKSSSKIPKIPRTPRTQDTEPRTNAKEKLTKSKVNRKRPRAESSPDNQGGPATPSANKRRTLGAPGSTPFARHHTPLTRRLSTAVPYSERLRRRRAESQGRIHSTIFRLPQLVAQTEADRLASETPAPIHPPAEPLNPDLDLSASQDEPDDQVALEQAPVAQEPITPEPARRGWNISGLFNSVPRSFSRFLPKFGRSPASSQAPAPQEPASERIRRLQPSETFPVTVPENASQSRRRSSDQPPAKRPRNLTYSLFPTPIDRDLYLGDITSKPTTKAPATSAPAPALASTPSTQSAQPDLSLSTQPKTSVTPSVVERGRDVIPQASNTANESQKKKRKRSASPDVIPNPVGSSYGMDLDYFCYSSESEDEEEDHSAPQTEPRNANTLARTTTRSIIQSERPASKKVRFDASPEDTPSKHRARATDPYHGRHFIGMSDPPTFSAPTTPTPAPRVADPRERPGFIPNRSGTFELDYDAVSDDSDSSGAPSPPSVSTPSAATRTPSFTQPGTPPSAQIPTPRATSRLAQAPSTPAKIDEEALARARSQAEKYKPKTPSGLRTASRYSSPLTATPDLTPAPHAEKTAEKFGDDQFAKDAQWLYENCPSGDLRQLAWPAPRPFGEGLNVSPESIRIANEIWDPSDVDKAYVVFQREIAEFKQTLA